MKSKQILMLATIFVLLGLDWLTFHDFAEAHTMRDFLTLFASILVFSYFAMELSKKKK
ncbi:MAG TPA: hypothetical protein VKC54_02815 [Patescibacteria group bacterium]|nr:hypothetical protein [Patescibacteria group bacterium]